MRLSTTVPALPVRDVAAAVAFYAERLGFGCVHQAAGFAVVVRDDAEIHLWEADDTTWRGRRDLAEMPVRSGAEDFLAGTASCRVRVDDADALHTELGAAGVLHPVDRGRAEDTDWGTREFPTLDLDGNLITFFQRRDQAS
jgi:catechol 2,3-dioxygenase-like lactoylglutathione lyase family enzyme